MDEGDDYVPQISQLDYSLVDSGQNVLQNDPGIYSPPPPQIPLQHLQYGSEATAMHPCQLPNQMAPQSMQQQQVIYLLVRVICLGRKENVVFFLCMYK